MIAAGLVVSTPAMGNPINYGDVAINNATFHNVEESSSAGGNFLISPPPLYGAPIAGGSSLTFNTGPFGAGAMDSEVDGAMGDVTTVLQADAGFWIESFSFTEVGNYAILGNNSTVLISGVLDIRYENSAGQMVLLDSSHGFDREFELTFNGTGSGVWQIDREIDFVDLGLQVDRLAITLNNIVLAQAGPVEAAFVDKSSVTFNAAIVPEPGSIALLGAGGLLLLTRRRWA